MNILKIRRKKRFLEALDWFEGAEMQPFIAVAQGQAEKEPADEAAADALRLGKIKESASPSEWESILSDIKNESR